MYSYFVLSPVVEFRVQIGKISREGNQSGSKQKERIQHFGLGSTLFYLRVRSLDSLIQMVKHELPDVRDGLTQKERTVLWVLHQTQKERGDRNVPTVMVWGRVCEHFYISPEELSLMLARLGAMK